MDNEIWEVIKGYDYPYKVSNNGIVMNKHGKILTGGLTKNKEYRYVNLRKNKKPSYPFVHRLVALAFIQNPENKPEVNHIDGNKLNNHVSNLEWCTHQENMKHADKNGLMNYGSNHYRAILTDYDVIEIVRLINIGMSQNKIAILFGVKNGTISAIKTGARWAKLTGIKYEKKTTLQQ